MPEAPDTEELMEHPGRALSRGGRWWWLVGAVGLLAVGVMLWPFDFQWTSEAWLSRTSRPALALVGCALLWLPYGFCEANLARRILPWRALTVLAVALDGLCLVGLTEIAQAYVPGAISSALDLLAALIGIVVGAIIGDAARAERDADPSGD